MPSPPQKKRKDWHKFACLLWLHGVFSATWNVLHEVAPKIWINVNTLMVSDAMHPCIALTAVRLA